MLFAFIILLAVITTAVYVAKKTKTTTITSTEATPSIHEEIAKTVEEAKAQQPIEPIVVDETPKAKVAKMDAKPKTQSKSKAPKKKTVDA